MGVDLFFVLSGLLMSDILFEQRTPLGTFYRRRISRVIPVFLLFIVVSLAVAASLQMQWTIPEIAATLLFARAYFPADLPIWHSETTPLVGHLWSLNVEEHSYVILALLAAAPLVRKGWAVLALAGLGLAITAYYWKAHNVLDFSLRTETAAIPLLLSAGYRQVRFRNVPHWMPVLALALGVMCYLTELSRALQLFAAPFLFAFAVNHIGESHRCIVRALSFRPLCFIGVWSFSIYLWQQPFFALKQSGMNSLLAVGCGMIVSLLSFYAFEKPIREWMNANWQPKRPRKRPLEASLPSS
jgi:peptidoglycan/LPS O-acetylase OafA/YrhL